MTSLTSAQRRYLRSLGHHLQPVVRVGKEGSGTDGVAGALAQALDDHELIKVRLGTNVLDDPRVVADQLAGTTGAAVAQVLGNTILLYRPHPEQPKIVLPRP